MAKHPTKVHVWAGISINGPTAICIFDGITKQELFVDILASTLSPSINALYPGGHRLMMDIDPKHTSRYAAACMDEFKWDQLVENTRRISGYQKISGMS